MSRERVGVLRRALVEAGGIGGAVMAEERGLGGRSRVVAAVRAQWREERRLRLWGILPDHRHGEGGRGACVVRREA